MLSGRLPTGTVDDGAGGAERVGRPANADRADRARGVDGRSRAANASAGRETGAEARTDRGTTADRASVGVDADIAARNERLRRQLAAERAERRAVVDRYERLLEARRRERTDTSGCERGVGGRVAAGVRRALSRLRRWS